MTDTFLSQKQVEEIQKKAVCRGYTPDIPALLRTLEAAMQLIEWYGDTNTYKDKLIDIKDKVRGWHQVTRCEIV